MNFLFVIMGKIRAHSNTNLKNVTIGRIYDFPSPCSHVWIFPIFSYIVTCLSYFLIKFFCFICSSKIKPKQQLLIDYTTISEIYWI